MLSLEHLAFNGGHDQIKTCMEAYFSLLWKGRLFLFLSLARGTPLVIGPRETEMPLAGAKQVGLPR